MAPTTVRPSWTQFCWNFTPKNFDENGLPVPPWSSLNGTVLDGVADGGREGSSVELDDRDRHALLYIVVVLLFYSTGIVIAIVMYLKREKAEIEEEKAYDDYASFRSDPDRWARYFRVQRMIVQLERMERAAAEKKRLETESSERSGAAAKTHLSASSSASRSPRPRRADRSVSSPTGLKVHVLDTADPGTPLLGTAVAAGGHHPGGQVLGRTRSYAGTTSTGTSVELKRSPNSSTTLQVSNV